MTMVKYKISEKDGAYSSIDGSIQKADFEVYNGCAIWAKYREQLPMLSLMYSEKFGAISKSIANLYTYGKKDWATRHEPTRTVRTEHALDVLLDVYEKKYPVDFFSIKDSIIEEVNRLNFNTTDKALESSYDLVAASKIMAVLKDDDAGTMSSWFVMRSIGIFLVNIGTLVYYIKALIFKKVSIDFPTGKKFKTEVKN